MLKSARWIGLFVITLIAVPRLGAQELAQVCQGLTKLTVGQWASYAITGGQDDGATMRFAIISSERRGDTTLYWFEVNHTSSKDPAKSGVMQMLIPGWGVGGSSRALIMKMGTQPAMRMPDQMLAMAQKMNPGADMTRHCATAQSIGWESIAVPAGTVHALHVKDTDGNEAWVAQDVPFGLVKVQMADGGLMALSGRGTDAKSSITETPQDMPMPGMMNRP